MEGCKKFTMFKALRYHYKRLDKIAFTFTDPNKMSVYYILSVLYWVFLFTYNFQYLIKAIQTRHNTDDVVDTLFLFLTILSALFKQVMLNLRMCRIRGLFDVTEGYLFAPKHSAHIELLEENENAEAWLLFFFHRSVAIACLLQSVPPLVNRARGFDVKLGPEFVMSVLYLWIMLTIQGYVAVIADCTVVALYAQAKVQLRLLKYDLVHLADRDTEDVQAAGAMVLNNRQSYKHTYLDNDEIQKRLVQCVKHYQQIVWFTRETESVSFESVTAQFLLTAWVICMTLYKMVAISIFSVEFLMLIVYLACILIQFFIYCYHGTQVKMENDFVSQSVYSANWLALSPTFRRQLLILMTRCSRPLIPCAAKIVPVSLESYLVNDFVSQSVKYCGGWLALSPTFRRQLLILMTRCSRPLIPCAAKIVPVSLESYLVVLRLSYTLYTLLDKKN